MYTDAEFERDRLRGRVEILEDRLAKAVAALEWIRGVAMVPIAGDVRADLAEIVETASSAIDALK